MRLYHWTNFIRFKSILLVLLSIALWGCSQPQATTELITVSITADYKTLQLSVASGSTVYQALDAANIQLGELDEVTPALSAQLADRAQVMVVRVKEEFYTEQVIAPFEHQELSNEALPVGERLLSQPGVNGLKEITYRRLYKDGVEVSNSAVKTIILKAAIPEIEMIGTQAMFAAIPIPGTIAYLSAGNAWIIEGNTGSHKLVVSTGDLDGRIFSLSKDGKTLLFSRFSSEEQVINTLWIASLASDPIKISDLGINNVIHYAEFNQSSNSIAYSTAEWREASPGWQANNDLYVVDINLDGNVGSPRKVLESSSGGVYGWWGTDFAWAPDQLRFLYARPDSLGIIEEDDKTQTTLLDIMPYQSGGNWAWVAGTAWSPDGKVIYSVNYAGTKMDNANEVHQFDIIALPLSGDSPMSLVKQAGMFAYPIPSPSMHVNSGMEVSSGKSVEQGDFLIAYLQALHPDQSETSDYRLNVMDRDGSNSRALFPMEGDPGLSPQHIAWSPAELGEDANFGIVLVYNGNIWIIDAGTGEALQVTGDGLSTRVDWR